MRPPSVLLAKDYFRTGFVILSSCCLFCFCPAHTFAGEFDVVGIMHEAVEDGVPYCYSPGMARMRLRSRAARQRAAMSGFLRMREASSAKATSRT